jgi:hypothetical protein
MIYRGPSCRQMIRLSRSPHSPSSTLPTGGGGREWGGAISYNREKTWPSINHSILRGLHKQKAYDDIESRLLSLLAGAGCSATKSWRRGGDRIACYTRSSGHVTPPGQNRNENNFPFFFDEK